MTFEPGRYWNDRHQETAGLEGVGYLGLGPFNTWMYRVRAQVFRRALAPHAARIRGARVLDVGAGTGFYLDLWRSLGAAEVIGLDISEVACARLRDRHDVRCLDITTADPEAVAALGRFDFVSAMDVLYHVVDDERYARALSAIAGRLAPEGRLVFTENFLQRSGRQSAEWQVSRTKLEIEALCARAGLVIEARVPGFVLMNNPLDSAHAAPALYWKLLQRVVRRSAVAGQVAGAALFPLELGLTRLLRETPSSELALARRLG